MAQREPKIFDRVFSNPQMFQGRALRALIANWVGALCLAKVLFLGFLILELILVVGEGRAISVPQSSFERVFGIRSEAEVPDDALVQIPHGFQQVLWRNRNQVWSPLLVLFERRIIGGNEIISPTLLALLLLVEASILVACRRGLMHWAHTLRTEVELEIAGHLRSHIHRQVLRLGPADLQRQDAQTALELFKVDVGVLRRMLNTWLAACQEVPAQITLVSLLALGLNPTMTFYCAVPLVLYAMIQEKYRKDIQAAQALAQAHAQDELRLLAESLGRSRLVTGYGMEQAAQEHFRKYLDRYQKEASQLEGRWIWRTVFKGFYTALCILIVLVLSIMRLMSPAEHFSLAAALILAASFLLIGKSVAQWRQSEDVRDEAVPPAMRIFRYLDRIPEVGQAVGAKFLEPLSRSIDLLDVTYTAPDKIVLLDGLTCSITALRQVAVISTDTSSATALVSLLPRYIDPQQGQVLIDGEDIAWVTLESLRAETLVAGGPDVVFTGSVLENIVAGRPNTSLTEVTEAAKMSHALHFIQRLPQAMETVIGEHGESLDAGQMFRLALARAVLRDPALLIIEEPTASLDEDTKALIDDAYQRIASKRSVIYLPSRLATLKRCDEIILLHQGQIAARGSHAQLVKTSQLYRHWEYVRFNEFRHVMDGGSE